MTLPPRPDTPHADRVLAELGGPADNGHAPTSTESAPLSTWDADRALLAQVRNGAWLDVQDFPPLRWAVPGLIPEGFSLLIGPPKVGKSWLILDLLLAIAAGGTALGRIRVDPAPVLYLALEDGDRRMQDRCRTLMAGQPLPQPFHYLTTVEPGAVPATITAFLRTHSDTGLVVIDTLGKVMPPAAPNETTYGRDYRVGGRIKALADEHPGLAVVALHHDRKAAAEDFVERVSGTNGLAGSADTVIVLARKRQADDGLLMITGRDVREDEYALVVAGGQWQLDGSTLDAAAVTARQRHDMAGLGDRSAEIIAWVREQDDPVTPAEVAAVFGMSNDDAGKYLRRAVDSERLAKAGRGRYTSVRSVRTSEVHTVIPVDFGHSDTSDGIGRPQP